MNTQTHNERSYETDRLRKKWEKENIIKIGLNYETNKHLE